MVGWSISQGIVELEVNLSCKGHFGNVRPVEEGVCGCSQAKHEQGGADEEDRGEVRPNRHLGRCNPDREKECRLNTC